MNKQISMKKFFAGLIIVCLTIRIYADSEKHAPAYAAHFSWLLTLFGHTDFKILDGVLAAWQNAGYTLTDEVTTGASTEEVLAAVNRHDPNVIILRRV